MSDGQQQDPNTNDPGAQEPPVDWHDKFLGQKKVNNDLEAKLKTAYEKADRVDDLERVVQTTAVKAETDLAKLRADGYLK